MAESSDMDHSYEPLTWSLKYCKIGFGFMPQDEMIQPFLIFKLFELQPNIQFIKQIFQPIFKYKINIIYFFTSFSY